MIFVVGKVVKEMRPKIKSHHQPVRVKLQIAIKNFEHIGILWNNYRSQNKGLGGFSP